MYIETLSEETHRAPGHSIMKSSLKHVGKYTDYEVSKIKELIRNLKNYNCKVIHTITGEDHYWNDIGQMSIDNIIDIMNNNPNYDTIFVYYMNDYIGSFYLNTNPAHSLFTIEEKGGVRHENMLSNMINRIAA